MPNQASFNQVKVYTPRQSFWMKAGACALIIEL